MAGEAHELYQIAVDLGVVPAETIPEMQKAAEVTARHIKDSWNSSLDSLSGTSLRFTGGTVDYEVTSASRLSSFSSTGTVASVEAEIGPNLAKKQGTFAGWFEKGSVDGVPAAHPGEKALREWRNDFEEGLTIAMVNGLKKAIQ